MTWLLEFHDPLATRPELTGGKGANLALMTQRGFPVPPGVVLSVEAWRAFSAPAVDVIRAAAGFEFADPGRLSAQCAGVREALAALPLPAGLDAELRAFIASGESGAAYSVRSSSTMEDLAGAAFAGQHETYLNCRGEEEILRRIRDCYLSLWGDRAAAYRAKLGFNQADAAMAVVVQRMVFSEVAGVGFTVNAVSGSLAEMVLNANWGLGESVVSGEGEVDQYVLDKASGRIVSSHVAAKTRRFVSVPEGGTREESVPPGEAGKPCLDDVQLAALAGLLKRVEMSYGFPQDIEWAFSGGDLFLLQARPVTSIPPRWTRDESAERFPNVLTPLTWDLVEDGFHRSLAYSFRLMGYPPFSGKWFARHGRYIYGNQNAVELYTRRVPVSIKSLDDLREQTVRIREQYQWVLELPVLWSRDLDAYLIGIGELMARPLDGLCLAEQWAYVLKVKELGAVYFQPNIAISVTQAVLHRLLLGLCRLVAGPDAGLGLYDGLLAWCDLKTAAVNRELGELAGIIRSMEGLHALLRERPSRALIEEKHLGRFPAFAERFAKFLADHGHREVDFDSYHPTWVECPWVVLDQLRLLADAPVRESPAARERSLRARMQQSELELFRRAPEDLRLFFAEIVRLTRAYTSLDDLEHYQTTRLTLPFRKGLRAIGQELKARGIVEEDMDVFFATAEELAGAIHRDDSAGWKALAEAIKAEKAGYLRDREREPEWVFGESVAAGGPPPGGLTGLPGSPGRAEGPVFIVNSTDDFAGFPKGSVLVARTTNPAWTPLFYSAVAVVTESGGPLSHGAVTAREMQIPAVMGVRGALASLRGGRRVMVDGTAGRVVPLDT